MKKVLLAAVLMGMMLTGCNQKSDNNQNEEDMNTTLTLTQEWDKTFPKSDKVDHKKVTFKNRYGIELAADMYTPKGATGKLAALAVTGPFGAVKEQTSGLYAQHMAERGFLTIAFDPSFTGESGGEPRRMASPDINTEDFLAAVDLFWWDGRERCCHRPKNQGYRCIDDVRHEQGECGGLLQERGHQGAAHGEAQGHRPAAH